MLVGTDFIDEHTANILPEEQKVTIHNLTPVTIVKQHDTSANAVFRKKTQNVNVKTLDEEKDNQRSIIKHSNTIRVAKQMLLERLSATFIMATIKIRGLPHLHLDINLITKGYSPTIRYSLKFS